MTEETPKIKSESELLQERIDVHQKQLDYHKQESDRLTSLLKALKKGLEYLKKIEG